MKIRFILSALACTVGSFAWAAKSVEVAPGQAIPASIITTNNAGVFKADVPCVVPMVVVSFQTEVTEKGGSSLLGGGGINYTLEGISPALMQKIADEAQDAVESELKAGGWQVLPVEKVAALDVYKSWIQSPDPSVEEVKRSFFSAGKATNTFSSKEMERVFVGGQRPLVGNGIVLGGWTAAASLCKMGKAIGARVILCRVLVNFAAVSAGKAGLFSGQEWRGKAGLEIGYAEMQAYPPDASGATPARLNTDTVINMHSDFIKDVQKTRKGRNIIADPDKYEKDTVDAIRSVAKGFAGLTKK